MRSVVATLGVVVAVGVGSGCAAERDDWHGDERFTPDERVEIQRGTEWLRGQAGLPAPKIAWDYEVTGSEEIPKTIRRERGPGDGSSSATGSCSVAHHTVYLDPEGRPGEGMTLEVLAGLAAHEMAHCELGFVDGYHPSDAPTDGIMRVLRPMRWTHAEVTQCHVSAHCPSARVVTETANR